MWAPFLEGRSQYFCPVEVAQYWAAGAKLRSVWISGAGVFGKVRHQFYRQELQQTANPHEHRLVWSEGITLETMREKPEKIDQFLCCNLADVPDEMTREMFRTKMKHRCTDACRRAFGRCRKGFPFPLAEKTTVLSNGFVQFRRTCAESQWLEPTNLSLFRACNFAHVSVRLVNTENMLWVYLLGYNLKSDDAIAYQRRLTKKFENTLSELDEWRYASLHTCVGGAQRLFGLPLVAGLECGLLSVHFIGGEGEPEESDDEGEENDFPRHNAERPRKLTRLEQYWCRPKELETIYDPLQYHREYVVSATPPKTKTGEAFRDVSVARHYVYRRRPQTSPLYLRWEVPSVLTGERFFLYLLLAHSKVPKVCASSPMVAERELKAGRATFREVCVEKYGQLFQAQVLPVESLFLDYLVGINEKPSKLRFYVCLMAMRGMGDIRALTTTYFEALTHDLRRIGLKEFMRAKGHPRRLESDDRLQADNSLSVLRQMLEYACNQIYDQHNRAPPFATGYRRNFGQLLSAELTKDDAIDEYETLRKKISTNAKQARLWAVLQARIDASWQRRQAKGRSAMNLGQPRNVYIDGPGGVGKSLILRLATCYCRAHNIAFLTCAYTNAVALKLLCGRTIHRLFAIGKDRRSALLTAVIRGEMEYVQQAGVGFIDEWQGVPGWLLAEMRKVVEKLCPGMLWIACGAQEQRNYAAMDGDFLTEAEEASVTSYGHRYFQETFDLAQLDHVERCPDVVHNQWCADAGFDRLPKIAGEFVEIPERYAVHMIDRAEDVSVATDRVIVGATFSRPVQSVYAKCVGKSGLQRTLRERLRELEPFAQLATGDAVLSAQYAATIVDSATAVILTKSHNQVERLNRAVADLYPGELMELQGQTEFVAAGKDGADIVSAELQHKNFSGLAPGLITVRTGMLLQLLVRWGDIAKRETVVFCGLMRDAKQFIHGLRVCKLSDLQKACAGAKSSTVLVRVPTHVIFRIAIEQEAGLRRQTLELKRYQFPVVPASVQTFDNAPGQEWEIVTNDVRLQPSSHGQLNIIGSRCSNSSSLTWFTYDFKTKPGGKAGQRMVGLVRNVVNRHLLAGVRALPRVLLQ